MSQLLDKIQLETYSAVISRSGLTNRDVAFMANISDSYLSVLLKQRQACPDDLQNLIFNEILDLIKKEKIKIIKLCEDTPAEHAVRKLKIVRELKKMLG